MSFRITTGMMMNSYKYNLSQSTARMDKARNTVISQRKYDSYADDPASAAHEWRLRRSITRNAGYITSNSEAYSRLNTAWATMATIDDELLNGAGGAFAAIKYADNDPTGGARTALGSVLRNLAQSFVYSLNGAKYGDHFLFSGNDEMNAPFSWKGDRLYYRGIPVDAGGVKNPAKANSTPAWVSSELIPARTPTVEELREAYSDENGNFQDSLEYRIQRAWVDYYRGDGKEPSTAETPEWVTKYKETLENYKNGQTTDPDTGEPIDIRLEANCPEWMTPLDQAWYAALKEAAPTLDEENHPELTDDDIAAVGTAITQMEGTLANSRMIPTGTPTMEELEEKYLDEDGNVKNGMSELEYRAQRAWVDYYRNGGNKPNEPIDEEIQVMAPIWLWNYHDELVRYGDELAKWENGGKVGDRPVAPEPEVPEPMTELEQAYYMAFKSVEQPDMRTADSKTMIDYHNNARRAIIAATEELCKIPDWADEPPTMQPKDMPAVEDASTSLEKAWVEYFEKGKVTGKDENGDFQSEEGFLTPDQELGWDINDPTTWPPYPSTVYEEDGETKTRELTYEDYRTIAWLDYAYDSQYAKALEAMNGEVKNMDLGMGLQEATGNRDLLQSTVFNRAISGITATGFGVDENGDPNCIVSIMMRLSQLYSDCTENGEFPLRDEAGNIQYDEDGRVIEDQKKIDEVYRLLDKFNEAHDKFNQTYSDIDTRGKYLQSNAERLTMQNTTLQEQLYDVSKIDPALAIEEFSYTYYCYSAALKIGTQLLSQSLIDYMS